VHGSQLNYIKSISPGSADCDRLTVTVISLSECESSPNYESWQIMCRIFKLSIDTVWANFKLWILKYYNDIAKFKLLLAGIFDKLPRGSRQRCLVVLKRYSSLATKMIWLLKSSCLCWSSLVWFGLYRSLEHFNRDCLPGESSIFILSSKMFLYSHR